VVQKDFNIEAYDLLLSEGYLKGLQERLQSQFDAVDARDRLMPGMEQGYYNNLYIAKSSIAYIAEKIEKAKGVFRNRQAFYDINALHSARNTMRQAQSIISIGCFPTGQDLIWPMNNRLQRSLADIEKITQNRAENPFLELYEQHLMPFILKEDPDVIGISVAIESQWIPALTLSRLIKSSYKKAHVVVGGCLISLLSGAIMKYEEMFNTFFDSAVINEGELPLLKLVENISHGRPLNDVPNLIYLDNGRVRANEVLPSEDINSLPTPCFDGLPLDSYLTPEPVLTIVSSRGCYWSKCAFCSDNLCFRWRYKNRDASKVVDDMQELSQKYGVTRFAFSDEAISPSAAHKLSDEIIRRGLKVKCSASVRLERQFTPELCNKMFQAGFRFFYFGLESGCNRILNLMQKGITKEVAAEVCRNVHNAGIWNHLYTFLGFPTETRAEAQETLDFLLLNRNNIGSFNINHFILPKGSPMIRHPEQYGLKVLDAGPDTDFSLSYNYAVSSGLTSDEALELSMVSRERIAREYKNNEFFKLELQDDIFLYLCHFEKSDPFSSLTTKARTTGTQPGKQLTRKSIPRVKHNVVLDKLRFDVMGIINNISSNRNLTVYPNATFMIFDPVSERFCPISLRIVEILALCDGKKSVQQIAHELSDKYDGKWPTVEEDCIDFLQSLSREGYVLF